MTVKAGANFGMILGVGSQAFNHFGAAGGMQFNWRFAPKFSFNPELIYAMKGGRRNPDPENGDYYSYSIDLDYIELPALFRWHMDKKELLSLEFGPTFGFLVRKTVFENQMEVNQVPPFRPFDLSLAAGINLHLPKGWGINARFTNSIMPILPGQAGVTPVGNIVLGSLNSVLSASVSYSFDLKKKEKRKPNDEALPHKIKEKKPKIKRQRGDVIDED